MVAKAMSDSSMIPIDSKACSSRTLTPHPDYEDHANRDDAWVKQRKYEMDMAAAKKSMGGAKETFPIKLFAMLETVSQSQEKSIVSWLPHGRSFKVHDRRRFEDVILPTYFRYQSEYLSFQRQLNVYGFLRITGLGPDNNSYYHAMFLRGKSELAKLIPRVKCSPHSKKRTFDANTEPDFYAMAPLPEPVKHVEKARRLHHDHSATSAGHPSGHVLAVSPRLPAAVPTAAVPAFAGYHRAQTSFNSAVLANSDFTTQPTSLPAVGSNLTGQPLPLRGMMTMARSSASVSESAYTSIPQYGARPGQREAILAMMDGTRASHQRGLDPSANAFAVPYATPSNAFGQNSLIENTLAFPLPLHAPLSSHTDNTEPTAKRFRPNNDVLPQFVPRSRDDTANEPLHDVDVSSDWLEKTDFNTFW